MAEKEPEKLFCKRGRIMIEAIKLTEAHTLLIAMAAFFVGTFFHAKYNFLKKYNIGCGVNYRSVTDMSIFKKKFGWSNKTCKNSKYLGDNTLSLPLYPDLTIKDVNYICEKIHKFFKS